MEFSVNPDHRKFEMNRQWIMGLLLLAGAVLSWAVPRYELLNPYLQLVLMYLGINIILATSLNLINGYLGEFSVGHAGFMAVGAYSSACLTVMALPEGAAIWRFPLAITGGGVAAALTGLIVAIPSFRTRGDYLAIVTLAFAMMIKSALENIEVLGGPRGLLGIENLSTLPWVFGWTVLSVWVIRNFVYSNPGRGVLAIREDEIAAELTGVNTRRVKIKAFMIASFFAGAAGGLFAHLLQFISPRIFDIMKTTDILVMVYLGGVGSIGGSVVGATLFTVFQECLRPLGVWRMIIMPLLLVLLMLFRPNGIMGMREFAWLRPSVTAPSNESGDK